MTSSPVPNPAVSIADGDELPAVQLDPAALALACLEQRGPGRAGLGADAVVQRQQRCRDAAGHLCAGSRSPLTSARATETAACA
jgi:hypothetical protein